ncbi:MAG TPA: HlyD family efflux transporter periplasmic adaptor subunit [Terriglobales bacterium]|nr:HlyD family efflux transporter periplasmic adaptor subunit [Terriglobales bacterium]
MGLALLASLANAGCGRAAAQRPRSGSGSGGGGETVATASLGRLTRLLRVGGTTTAVHAFTIRIPQIPGQSSQFVLVGLVANGAQVKKGEVLAQFDATAEVQNALDAKAKYDDLRHQVDDTTAQNKANAEQRASDLQQAEADLGKAELELKKAPILSAIEAQTDRLNVEDAKAHIASLERENAFKAKADAAGLRVLELKRDQQQVEWERAQSTVEKLTLRAPLAGMVGLVPVFHANTIGPAQPGDQLYSGSALLRIFDPGDMNVAGQINEADSATLAPGLEGVLHLDAYPKLRLAVHFLAANPVAVAGGFGVPTRTFAATFHVEQSDPRLLPDLSAAVDLKVTSPQPQLLVPRPAVHFVRGQPYVSVRGANGQWREQAVELGNFDDQQVAILGGLRAGQQVGWRESGGGE